MKVQAELEQKYKDYYGSRKLSEKRALSAHQSVYFLDKILRNNNYSSLIDVGAGEGAVLQILQDAGIVDALAAVEISETGYQLIKERDLNLTKLALFDGYNVPAHDDEYSIAVALHVVEHVEHERAFLNELARIAKYIYLEVPLELRNNLQKSILAGRPNGHINFYNVDTFSNLLETSGLRIIQKNVYPPILDYEIMMGGALKGITRFAVRRSLLRISQRMAQRHLSFIGTFLCEKV